MAETLTRRVVITPPFRMSFPKLLTAEKYVDPTTKAEGAPKYSVQGIFEPADIANFRDASTEKFDIVDFKAVCAAAIQEKWPGIVIKDEFSAHAGLRNWPIKDGDTLVKEKVSKGKKPEGQEHLVGKKQIAMSSGEKFAPSLYCVENSKRRQLVRGVAADDAKIKQLFVSGSYAYAELTIVANEQGGKKYCTPYLNAVTFHKAGPKIGGGQGHMERFAGYQGGTADHDPTGGAADADIPL